MAESKLTHPTYNIIEDDSQADAWAWVFTNEKLDLKKVAIKFPPLKANECRAKVTYTGLCHSDIHTANGDWGATKYPIAPGHEIVGIITDVGTDVKDFKVGDKVGFGTQRESCQACKFCKSECEQLCVGQNDQKYTYGSKYWGGYASAIQHPARFFYRLPDGIPEEKIPPLFCAGVTVHAPIVRFAKPGDEVAVLGIGGLGHLAVYYAKAWGCKVTAFTSSKDKEDFIKRLGADRVVLSDEKTVKEESFKYHLVINTLPVLGNLTPLVNLCEPLGTFVQVGLPPVAKPGEIQPANIVFWQITYTGSNTGSKKEVQAMLDFSAKHKIVPLCEQFDFEDFPKAIDRLINGKPIFRCVVDCTKVGKK